MSLADVSRSRVSSVGLTPNPVDAGKSVITTVGLSTVTAKGFTAPASGWTGSGPYTQTVAVSGITTSGSYIVFVDPTASLMQRAAEYNAVIRVSAVSGGVALTALGIRPDVDLPMRIVDGAMDAAAVTVSSWSGSGPWTATATLPWKARTAAAGPVSGSTDAQAQAVIEGGVHVSAISGSTVTLRAMFKDPGAVTLGVVYLRRPLNAFK